jgi:peptide/nickel transport system permease protein
MTTTLIPTTDPRPWRRSLSGASNGLTGALAAIPIVVIAVYVIVAVVGPILMPYDPIATELVDRLLPPGSVTADGGIAILGTDATGRDVLAQVIYGARTSMIIGGATVLICSAVGLVVGLAAGFWGGGVDFVMSRVIDILIAFPGIVLAIVVAGLFERGMLVVIVALSLSGWVSFARLTRSATLSLKERDWVSAAQVTGVPTSRIQTRHILPFVVGPVAALLALEFGLIVLGEAGLSFLGIGLPPSTVSWGQTIAAGKEYLATAWWISAFPGVALALLVVMVGLLGDQLNSRYQRGGAR